MARLIARALKLEIAYRLTTLNLIFRLRVNDGEWPAQGCQRLGCPDRLRLPGL